MSRRSVRLTRQAQADLDRLRDFLSEVAPDAAIDAAERIQAEVMGLMLFSERGAPRGDLRELYIPFGNSGYVAQYRVESDAVIVARIFHMREAR